MRQFVVIPVLRISTVLAGALFAATSLAAASPAAQRGTLETAGGAYEFEVASCGIHADGDGYDVALRGPGTTPDGERFHLDLSSGELTIDLGVDAPFKTSDRQIRAGNYISKEFALEVADRVVTVTDLVLVDERGQSIDPDARLQINCSL